MLDFVTLLNKKAVTEVQATLAPSQVLKLRWLVALGLMLTGAMLYEFGGLSTPKPEASNIKAPLEVTLNLHKTPKVTTSNTSNLKNVTTPSVKADDLQTVVIRKGDSLSKIFQRLKLNESDAVKISQIDSAASLRRLKVGRKLILKIDNGKLLRLEYDGDQFKPIVVTAIGREWVCSDHELEVQIKDHFTILEVERNLSESCAKNGLPAKVISEISQALAPRVNLQTLKGGERLGVAYREFRIPGENISKTELLGLDYATDDYKIRLIAFASENNGRGYFTPEGIGVRSQFSRFPLNKVKVSSRFNRSRRHPIFGTNRPHLGVDLSAPFGTPVYATSNGIVDKIGFYGGYGRLVQIKNGIYSTRYAHLSDFAKGLKRGSPIKKGMVIGYVGSSGTSTSAHLHYEFRINGVPYDPVRVKLPGESLLASRQRGEFLAAAQQVEHFLDLQESKKANMLGFSKRAHHTVIKN